MGVRRVRGAHADAPAEKRAGSYRRGHTRISGFPDLGFAGGLGPTNFYFTQNPLIPDGPHDNAHEAAVGLNGTGAVGIRLRLLPRGSRVRLDLRAERPLVVETRHAQLEPGPVERAGETDRLPLGTSHLELREELQEPDVVSGHRSAIVCIATPNPAM